MNNSNILVVEDDAAIRSLITTALETENYKYHVAKKMGVRRLWKLQHRHRN